MRFFNQYAKFKHSHDSMENEGARLGRAVWSLTVRMNDRAALPRAIMPTSPPAAAKPDKRQLIYQQVFP